MPSLYISAQSFSLGTINRRLKAALRAPWRAEHAHSRRRRRPELIEAGPILNQLGRGIAAANGAMKIVTAIPLF